MRGGRLSLAIGGGGLLVGLLYLLSAERVPREAGRSRAPEVATEVVPRLAGAEAEPDVRSELAPLVPELPSGAVAEPAHDRGAWARPIVGLDVTVREADGRVVPEVALTLASTLPPHREGAPLALPAPLRRTGTSDAEGRARFEGLPAGTYALEGVAPDGRWARRTFGVFPGSALELTLPTTIRPRSLDVRVLGTNGRPVAGARVEVVGALAGNSIGPPVPEEPSEGLATSDADGRAIFAGDFSRALFVAQAPDGRTGRAVFPADPRKRTKETEVLLVVDAPGALEGRLTGLQPDLLPRAHVRAYALSGSNPYHTTLQRALDVRVLEGRYRFDALPAGKWTLTLEDPDGARLVLGRMNAWQEELANSLAPLEVEVRAGVTSVQDLAVVRGAVLEGRVRTLSGEPVAGAEVRTTFAPETSNFPDGFRVLGVNVWRHDSAYVGEHPLTHRGARTDAEGAYRLAGLPPGKLRVEVLAAGLSYDRREDVELVDGETARLEHVLEPCGAIEGVEPNAGYLGVRRLGDERPRMIAVLPKDGRFAFPGLEAGRWRLESVHSNASIEPVPLVEVDVLAGETTWVDLGAVERPVRIAGRVLDGRGPVAGAGVELYPLRKVTDAEGRFLFWRSFSQRGAGYHGPSLDVRHGDLLSRFEVLPLAGGGWEGDVLLGTESLRVQAFDVQGAAASVVLDLSMELDRANEGGVKLTRIRGLVRVDGEETIDALAPGPCRLEATFENGSVFAAQVELPTREPVVLRAPPSGELELTLRLADGSIPSEASVSVWTWTGAGPPPEDADAFAEQGARRGADADEGGRAILRGVAAGEIQVIAFARPFLRSEVRRLRLEAGETRVLELVLAPEEPR